MAIPAEKYVENDQLIIRAELPGIDPDKDESITVADNVVRINARRRKQRTSEKEEMYRSELRYGSFSRAIPLPVDSDADAVTASYSDGILTVRLPVGNEPTDGQAHPSEPQLGRTPRRQCPTTIMGRLNQQPANDA